MTPSTCFEPEGSSSGRQLYYGTFYMHQYKQYSRYKSVWTTDSLHWCM